MRNHITIDTLDGTFQAYIAQPEILPAPSIVVIQEIFGVNADLRDTCDELALQGYLAISPDLFWRMEPGVEMSEENPLWYLTSPVDEKSIWCLPSNSENRSDGIFPSTLTRILSRPRCVMPITISCTPLAPARWIISSTTGISDSPPSSENRFCPT